MPPTPPGEDEMIKPPGHGGGMGTPTRRNLYTGGVVPMPEGLAPNEERLFASPRGADRFDNPWGVSAIPPMLSPGALKVGIAGLVATMKGARRVAIPVAPHPLGGLSSLPPGVRLMWLGHCTFLIEVGGLRVLTDPIFGAISGAPLHRLVRQPLSVSQLPDIDVVVISHAHRDHLCPASLEAIGDRFGDRVRYLVPEGTVRDGLIPWSCRQVTELSWWEWLEFGDTRLTFLPAQHWHRRGARDTNMCLWGSWMIEGGGRRLFFCGDSGYFDGFALFGRLFGGFDVAMMPLGAYEPREAAKDCHMDPAEAIQAVDDLGAEHLLAMHWGTYSLGSEGLEGGLHALRRLVRASGRSKDRFHFLAPGGSLGFEGQEAKEAYSFDDMLVQKPAPRRQVSSTHPARRSPKRAPSPRAPELIRAG